VPVISHHSAARKKKDNWQNAFHLALYFFGESEELAKEA
jgi:hypothetical protein